jgi:hypothetical protein
MPPARASVIPQIPAQVHYTMDETSTGRFRAHRNRLPGSGTGKTCPIAPNSDCNQLKNELIARHLRDPQALNY